MDYQRIIGSKDFKPYWVDMPDEEYHAITDFVGSSSLRKAIKSAAAFHANFFMGHKDKETDPMRIGRLIHLALLQGSKFKDSYLLMPTFIGKTKDGRDSEQSKEAKEKKAAWLAEVPKDAVICTAEERDNIVGMIESVLSHPTASKLLSDGVAEQAGFYVDEETGIKCKIKPDFLKFNASVLIDLKKANDCQWSEFRRSVEKLRYDVQMSHYAAGIKALTGKEPDHKVWIAVEDTYPFEVRCHEMSPHYDHIGSHEHRLCLQRIKNSVDTGLWSQGQPEVEIGEISGWMFNKYQLQDVV